MNPSVPGYQQVEEALARYSQIAYQHFVHDEFLTWKWWLLLCLGTVPWLIWWRIVDKRRTHEVLLYGLFIANCAVCVDLIGTQLLLWGYPDKLIQFSPPLIPADLTLVPISLMIVYQFFGGTWRSFLIATVAVGLFNAYVGEPLFIWLNFYQLHNWKLFCSFLFYIVASVIGRLLVQKTMPRRNAVSTTDDGHLMKPGPPSGDPVE